MGVLSLSFCYYCGFQVDKENKFCQKCGKSLQYLQENKPIPEKKISMEIKKPTGGLIVSLIGGIFAIFLGLGYESLASVFGGQPTPYGTMTSLAGILMIVGAIIGYRGRLKLGGVLVILFSLMSFVGMYIFAFLPVLLGIIGGVLLLIGK